MAIRRVLVLVSGDAASRLALMLALRCVQTLGAHADVLHVRPNPQESVPLLGEGVSGAMIEDLIKLTEKEAATRAEAARAAFFESCTACDVPVSDEPAHAGASAAFLDVTGREDDETVRRGRLSDLIVIPHRTRSSDPMSDLTLNASLFESGRPVLVAPEELQSQETPGRRVAIAWNGSAEAARAVSAALPILQDAEVVTVFSAETSATPGDAGKDLVAFLRWHRVEAQVGRLPKTDGPIGGALLDGCKADDLDLLVMGAYTHSRLRELFLGGVTRHVLDVSRIPILMSH